MQGVHFKRSKRDVIFGKQQKVSLGLVTLSFVSVFILCLLALFYIVQTNEKANQGYSVSSLEEEIKEVKNENKKIETEIAKLRSIKSLEIDGGKLNLKKSDPGQIKEIEVVSDVVVFKD